MSVNRGWQNFLDPKTISPMAYLCKQITILIILKYITYETQSLIKMYYHYFCNVQIY